MRIVPLCLIIIFSVIASAQVKSAEDTRAPVVCSKEVKDLPAIRNIKLRMPSREFDELLGRRYLRLFSKSDLESVPGFQGVDSLIVNFYKDRLSFLNIEYTTDIKWDNLKEFREVVAPQLNLPLTGWTPPGDVVISKLICKDFQITLVVVGGTAEFSLEDTAAQKAEAEEKQKAQDQKKKTFKP